MSDRSPAPDDRRDAGAASARDLPEAARRALEEAKVRRAEAKATPPREFNGRGGLDPARYGDWEVKGIRERFLTS